jgi:2'-5' RNA ligase
MLAVSAWFDEGAERAVRELWRAASEAGLDGSLDGGPYRPHLTLGVWERAEHDAASRSLERVAAATAPLTVSFRALGIYPDDPGVYLTPTVTAELRTLHERVHAALDVVADGSVERHRPGRWEPHCTVAWRLDRRDVPAVVSLLLEADVLPLDATITRLGLIDTPAEIELGSHRL